MIVNFREEREVRETGVIYNSVLNQIKMLHAQDPAKAGEFAISAIELVLTGDISSDDFMIKLALENMKAVTEKNQEKYDKKVEAQKQKKFEEMRLAEIAELHNQGFTQKEIGIKLNIPQQTISYRLNNIIKVEYPDLIVYQNTKNTKNTNHDNDNVNDNDNDRNLICANAQTREGHGAIAPSPKEFRF